MRKGSGGPRIAGEMGQGGEEKQEGRDERRGRRLAVDLPGTLGGRPARAVRVVDLSLVGCLVRLEAPLDEGVVVDLGIDLPGGPVRMKARVAESARTISNPGMSQWCAISHSHARSAESAPMMPLLVMAPWLKYNWPPGPMTPRLV